MSRETYRRKRDLSKSTEPDFAQPHAHSRAVFVVQLHHATRRHFDFRLQVGDALKSWAVPKGPSFDPAVKRLAVEVEDHPVAYAEFEGDIEDGYGKGHVDIFDHGVWATPGDAQAQLDKGHLRLELYGEKLQGAWHLVRSHRKQRQPNWFLIKVKDRHAGKREADDLLDDKLIESTRRAARTPGELAVARKAARKKAARSKTRGASRKLPRLARQLSQLTSARRAPADPGPFKPQLARLQTRPPQGDAWLHEVKWDGYRLLAAIKDREVRLWSRNGVAYNSRVPEIVQAVGALGLQSARLDGELIALADGVSHFALLQKTLAGEAQAPLMYMLFDMPYLEGFDIAQSPLLERKQLLEAILEKSSKRLGYSSHWIGDGVRVLDMATQQKLEGIVSKRSDSPYRAGRSDSWIKTKRLTSDEFAVIGYTLAKGQRKGFGALLLAKPEGRRWRYAGRVGTGFSDAMLRDIARELAHGGRKQPDATITGIDPQLRDARWIEPRAVAEVYYRGISDRGLLRQPSLKTLRQDKSPADLRDTDHAPTRRTARCASVDTTVHITHPDRVVYPDMNLTKQDVVDYYTAIMKHFLPNVVDRPIVLLRCPSGIAEPCFYQKHHKAGLDRIGTVKLKEESGSQAIYLYPRDASGIVELVQFGTIEFHPWGSTRQDPDRADRIVFDLDPGEDVDWPRVVAAARLLRKLLKETGLTSFVRTTGGKGLHVVVPLDPPCPWKLVKNFTQGFAKSVADLNPVEFVATSSKRMRRKRIYIDYLRNSRGATSVANYSLRARKGAPVAVPLRWSELGKLKSGRDYDIHSTRRRIANLRTDPWSGFAAVKQDLQAVFRNLER
ncbi:MAG TPA: DNA ligase D [Rhodanobacteraceae bacterium]|nr:DNA ligase D [Rhodanobacteraceae bacterium]